MNPTIYCNECSGMIKIFDELCSILTWELPHIQMLDTYTACDKQTGEYGEKQVKWAASFTY